MFSFFETIFSIITSAIAGIIISMGLVSAPAIPDQPATVAMPLAEETIPDTTSDAADEEESQNDALLAQIQALRAEVDALKSPQPKPAEVKAVLPQAPSVPSAPVSSAPSIQVMPFVPSVTESEPPAPKTVTLPSGIVVELDSSGEMLQNPSQPADGRFVTLPNGTVVEFGPDGEIIRYLDESGSTASQTGVLQIFSVQVFEDIDSARITWETNKSTQSTISISGSNFSTKEFTSTSGSGTRHTVTVDGLDEDTEYSYEIEAEDNTASVKSTGEFLTKALSVKGNPYVYTLGSTKEYFLYFETYQSIDVTIAVKFKDAGSTVTGEFSTSGKVHAVALGSEIATEIQRLLDEDKNSAIIATIKFDTSKGTEYEFTLPTDNPAIKY